MAKKYVDIEEILKHKRKMRGFGLSSEEEFWDFAVLVEDINNTPAADVEAVRHGYWKQNPHMPSQYSCSLCGRHIEDERCNPKEHFPYCHCGAKMDDKERERG